MTDDVSQEKGLATAEKSLRKSDARFRVIADQDPNLIWMSGPDKLCIWFNRTWLEFTGRTMAQELGKGWADGVHPDDLARCLDTYEKAFDARIPFVIEYRLRRHDGEWRWVFDSAIPLEGPEKNFTGYIGYCLDITERKQTDEVLRLSEERYRTLFNTLIEGFCIVEMVFDAHGKPVDYRFLETNPAFEKQTGWHDVQGKLIRDLAPDNEEEWLEIYGNIALTGEPSRFVREAKALNRWYEVSAFRFGGAESRKVAILFNDITEFRRSTEALLLSEQRERERAAELAAILHTMPTPVLIANDPDCVHITGNRAADELLRNTPGAELSLTAPEEIRPRHYKAVKDGRTLASDELPSQRAARGFPVQNFEFSLVFNDGTKREMLAYATPLQDEVGRPRGAVNVMVDITDRKQAELARSRLAAIVEFSGDAIMGRALDGTISEWNRGAEVMLGYSAEEIIGQPVLMLVPPDRAGELHVHEQIQRGEIVPPFETIRIRKDGRPIDVMIRVSPIRDAAGNIIGASAILRDITERKRLEKEVLEISEREQSRIGQDLHDGLCQHLAGIEFRLLSLQQKLQGKANKQAAEMTELAKRVRQAIEQTRNMARGLSPVGLESDGLGNALQELAFSTEKAFDISCSLNCHGPVSVHDNAVAIHLYRIAQEAINNAIRHGKAKFIEINLLTQGDSILLGVRDDGAGITERLEKHNGMGLRIMQYRADMIKGSLVVQREPGGGTCVVCSVPLPRTEHFPKVNGANEPNRSPRFTGKGTRTKPTPRKKGISKANKL